MTGGERRPAADSALKLVKETLAGWELELGEGEWALLDRYIDDLLEHNAKVNLTAARERQMGRQGKTNAEMGLAEIKQYCRPEEAGIAILRSAVSSQRLSARGYHRVLKLARSIADLAGAEAISRDNIAEALMFRPKMEL